LRSAAARSEAWDGKPIKRVRATDGVTLLPGRWLSMHLLVQPDAAAGFLGNPTLRDQGLLSRALPLGAAALQAWRCFFDRVERDCGRGKPLRPIGDFAAKAAEHAGRIVGVLRWEEPASSGSSRTRLRRDRANLRNEFAPCYVCYTCYG
jgi:hypothetical protein